MIALATALQVFLLSTLLHSGHCERSELRDAVTKLEVEMKQLKAQFETFKTPTGFTVRMKNLNITGLTLQQTIKFDNVIYSEDNGYDPETGVYTAMLPGTYVFHLQVMNNGSSTASVNLDIFKNNEVYLARAHAGFSYYESGAALVLTKLQAGDKVLVKITRGDCFWGEDYTSFSGFRLSYT